MKESCSKRWGTATYIVQHTLDLQRRFGHLDPLPTSPYKYPQRYFRNHSAAALNDPSFPAFTFGSLKSPLTANPWVQPSKYSRLYPGANFPPPKISSAISCASFGNRESTSQLLIRRGALTVDAYFFFFFRKKKRPRQIRKLVFPNENFYQRLASRSSGTTRKDGWDTTATLMTSSNARLKTYRPSSWKLQ